VVPITIDKRGDPEISTDSENVTVAVKTSPALEVPLELPEEEVSAKESTIGVTELVEAEPLLAATSTNFEGDVPR
jgi:hypothetical protein